MTSKIKIVSWIFITVLFISGCGKKQSTTSTSSPSSTSETTMGETNPSVSTETTRSSTQSVDNQPLSVEGNWTATGKEDHLESNWLFKDSTLTINGQEIFYYDVAPKVDKNGYTHVEIVNVESIIHGLLLKKSPSGMSGYRVEGEAYQNYLKTAELPTNQQEIEFISSIGDPTIWKNKDEAIDFYEKVYKNPANELSKDINWENYRRDLWNVLQDGTYDNVIAMHFSTINGSGGSYIRLIRDIETTEMILFGENSSYPDHPSSRLVIRNSDYLVLETENY